MKILVTGADGFVGSALVKKLLTDGVHSPIAAVRKLKKNVDYGCPVIELGDISKVERWHEYFCGIDVIVHTAGRVHITNEKSTDPLGEFRKINVIPTIKMADAAAKSGVRRFIFLSSIKVNGEFTQLNTPFRADDTPKPVDPYGLSKLEAELGLFEVGNRTGMEIVCVRPTLIYGPGVKGNFLSLLRLINFPITLPIPLGGITHNKRSFLGLSNCVDLLVKCINNKRAANNIFLAADGQDISTAELIRFIGKALDRGVILIAVPTGILTLILKILKKGFISDRLLSNLQVDIEKNKALLDWQAPSIFFSELSETAKQFKKNGGNNF